MSKIRVAAVSYLNTKPLLYGIRHHPVFEAIELTEGYPAHIAQMLIDDQVDIGLIPVAATLELPHWEVVSDYCIGCMGAVASVCIFSEVPMEEVEAVYLDYQSRTSVNLARVLLREYWKKDVAFRDATGEDFRDRISGTTAGVVIGDRALEQRLHSRFIYDLGDAWVDHTGLPFVFAAWVANKPLPPEFIHPFNEANRLGLEARELVIREHHFPDYDLHRYFYEDISYELTEEKRKGMTLFLEKVRRL